MLRRSWMLTALATSAVLLGACTTSAPSNSSPAERRAAIDSGADATLAQLYSSVPGSRELAGKSRAVLIFPKVYNAGLGIGGEYGEGALRVGGRTADYYKTVAVSFGFQAGAQSKALIMMFMTQDALDKFRASNGWTAGADASVALIKLGANGTIDTTSANAAVNAFALTNAGLMYAATIDGSKVSKIEF